MSERKAEQLVIGWAAVAWTQFLVCIAVVEKADRDRAGKFFWALFNLFPIRDLDTRSFGIGALMFNVVSMALLTYPLMGWRNWDKEDAQMRHFRIYGRKVAVAA